MQEGDAFLLGAKPRYLVDQSDTRGPATLQRAVEVVDRKTHMVDSRTPLGDELANRGGGVGRFQQLHERLTGGEASDPGAVGVVERDLGHPEDIAI